MWNKKSRLFTESRLEFCLWFRDTAVPQEQSWDKFTSPQGNPEHSMMGNPNTYVVWRPLIFLKTVLVDTNQARV